MNPKFATGEPSEPERYLPDTERRDRDYRPRRGDLDTPPPVWKVTFVTFLSPGVRSQWKCGMDRIPKGGAYANRQGGSILRMGDGGLYGDSGRPEEIRS